MSALAASSTLFESIIELPSADLRRQADSLIGFTARRERLLRHLSLLSGESALREWAAKHHAHELPVLAFLQERYPLVIFAGDVGTGKTATAEALADTLARTSEFDAYLFKLSTRVRGSGRVGEMSTLLNQAFGEVMEEAGSRKRVTLLLDEADSLAAARSQEHSHHEDKVAVNTLIQKIDELRRFRGRIIVFLCTNRFDVLDAAIVRRAAIVEIFQRPNEIERHELLERDLRGLDFTPQDLQKLVLATGPQEGCPGFTYSDLRTRLYPEAVSRAYPERKISIGDFLSSASTLGPSPEV